MPSNDFLGKGMKFPPQINKATGRFVTSDLEQSVKESVYIILMTAVGERIMRPDFGSNLASYSFMDVNATTVNLMRRNIVSQITRSEPRISEVTIEVDDRTRPGALLVDITYTIKETNTRDNLVFPFYLNNDMTDDSDSMESDNYESAGYIEDEQAQTDPSD